MPAASAFAQKRHDEIRALLAELIQRVAKVDPGDELGNFEIAMRWALESFSLHQARGLPNALYRSDNGPRRSRVHCVTHLCMYCFSNDVAVPGYRSNISKAKLHGTHAEAPRAFTSKYCSQCGIYLCS